MVNEGILRGKPLTNGDSAWMNLTPYHAKYFAHELTKRCPSDSIEKLASALVDAQVDLNPHQVEAALFAFRSPLSKGALLADEVGLGKTIEAGLVLSQKWAERKRRVLVITPSNLRKQWYQELQEKFFLPSRILETKSYNVATREGNVRPFECSDIVICSYQFARLKAAEISLMRWDLVVIDEAHRQRNVYKPTNRHRQHDYQPDFVAETGDCIYMLEPKAKNEMASAEVLAKKDAAVLWCNRATAHAQNNGGKPWRYVLIPHDVIAENMTLAGLVTHFVIG